MFTWMRQVKVVDKSMKDFGGKIRLENWILYTDPDKVSRSVLLYNCYQNKSAFEENRSYLFLLKCTCLSMHN